LMSDSNVRVGRANSGFDRRLPGEIQMRNSNSILFVAVLALASLLSACGGGGGSAGLSYTGVTTAAVIANGNAEPLALESFSSGMNVGSSQNVASSVSVVNAAVRNPDAGIIVSRLIRASRTAAQGLVTTSTGGGRATLVSIQQAMTPMTGGCGGSASGSLTINDVTSDIYASIAFDSYCEAGVSLSGSMNFSLILDSASADYGLMTMNFNNLRITDAIESVVMSGSLRFDSMILSPTITINMLLQDPVGKVYKMKDFVMTMGSGTDGTGDYADISMSGRLYDPDYGYVELSTTVPMRVYLTDNWPSSGSYVLTGQGNATVTLTASPSGYQLDLDLNGDGIDDGTPVIGTWGST
jgi:hypothetical protein